MSHFPIPMKLAVAAALAVGIGVAEAPAHASIVSNVLNFNVLSLNALSLNGLTANSSTLADLNGVVVEAVTRPDAVGAGLIAHDRELGGD